MSFVNQIPAYRARVKRSNQTRRVRSWILLALVGALLFSAAACGDSDGGNGTQAIATAASDSTAVVTPGTAGSPVVPPGDATNVLRNPGFEDGINGWTYLGTEAPEVSDVAHSGQAGALVELRADADVEGAGKRFLIQELNPSVFPELMSGYYRIENWKRGAPKQYVELAIIPFGSTNVPLEYPNHQIRYFLSGIAEEPGEALNARSVFLSRDEEPRQGEWVYFEAEVSEDFRQLWEAVPQGYSRIRVMFRVSYEDKIAGERVEADVHFDDIYLGPAGANPNQP